MYPVTVKVQRKQLARDERILKRTLEVLERLNMTAEQPSALAQAIEKIKQRAPDGLGRSIYPVTDKALCKQLRRDERTIQGAIELVKRMGIDPGARLALSRTYSAVNEYRKEASQEDLRKRLQKQPRREMTEEELLK